MKLTVNYRNITGTLPVTKLTPNTGGNTLGLPKSWTRQDKYRVSNNN
jgi:hypothetical protein